MASESIDFASEPGSEGTGLHLSRGSAGSSGSHQTDRTTLEALEERLMQDKAVLENPALRNNVRLISQVLQKRRAEESRASGSHRLQGHLDESHDGEDDEVPPMPSLAPPAPTARAASSRNPPWQMPADTVPVLPPALSPLSGSGAGAGSLLGSPGEASGGVLSMRSGSASVDRFLRAVSQVNSFAIAADELQGLVRPPTPSSTSVAGDEDDGEGSSSILFQEEGGGTSRSRSSRRSRHTSHNASAHALDIAEEGDEGLAAVLSSQTRRPQSSQRHHLAADGRDARAGGSVPQPMSTRLALQTPKNATNAHDGGAQVGRHSDDEEATPHRFTQLPLTPSPSGVVVPPAGGSTPHNTSPLRGVVPGLPQPRPSSSAVNATSFASQSATDTAHQAGAAGTSPWSRAADRYQRALLTPDKAKGQLSHGSSEIDVHDARLSGGDHEESEDSTDDGSHVAPSSRAGRGQQIRSPPAARPRPVTLSVSAIAAVTAAQEVREREERAQEEAEAAAQHDALPASRSVSVFGRFVEAITPGKSRHGARHQTRHSHDTETEAPRASHTDGDRARHTSAATPPKEGRLRRFSRRLSALFGGGRRSKRKQSKRGTLDATEAGKKDSAKNATTTTTTAVAPRTVTKPKRPTPAPPIHDYVFPPDTPPRRRAQEGQADSMTSSSASDSISVDVPFPSTLTRGGAGAGPSPPPSMGAAKRHGGAQADAHEQATPQRPRAATSAAWSSSARGGRGDNLSVLSDLVPHALPANALFAAADGVAGSGWVAEVGKEADLPPAAPPRTDVVDTPHAGAPEKPTSSATRHAAAAAVPEPTVVHATTAANTTTTATSVEFVLSDSALFPTVGQLGASARSTEAPAEDVVVAAAGAPGVHRRHRAERKPAHQGTHQSAAAPSPSSLFARSPRQHTDNQPGDRLPPRYFAPYNPESLLALKRYQSDMANRKSAYAERRRRVHAHYSKLSLIAPLTATPQAELPKTSPTPTVVADVVTETTAPAPKSAARPVQRKLSWALAPREGVARRRGRRSSTRSAAVRRLRRFSPLQFRQHARALADTEARLLFQLTRLDEALEARRRRELVRDTLAQSASAQTTPSRTPRAGSASAVTPPSIRKAGDEDDHKSGARGGSATKTTPRRVAQARTPSSRTACVLTTAESSKRGASGGGRRVHTPRSPEQRRPRPPLQRYYEDLVHLTLTIHDEQAIRCGSGTPPPRTTPRPASGVVAPTAVTEDELEPRAFAPRPFLHSPPADTARLRTALYHEYYEAATADAGTAAAVVVPSTLRPSCAACGPQSAPEYAALALTSLAEQLAADAASAPAGAGHRAPTTLKQTLRHELYQPYRGPPGKKPARKSSPQASEVPARPVPTYGIPFTPSAHAVIVYGLLRELMEAETTARVAIEEEELSTCLALCEDLVHVLLAEQQATANAVDSAGGQKKAEAEAENKGSEDEQAAADAQLAQEEEEEAGRTVVVPLPDYVRQNGVSCVRPSTEQAVSSSASSTVPSQAKEPMHGDDEHLSMHSTSGSEGASVCLSPPPPPPLQTPSGDVATANTMFLVGDSGDRTTSSSEGAAPAADHATDTSAPHMLASSSTSTSSLTSFQQEPLPAPVASVGADEDALAVDSSSSPSDKDSHTPAPAETVMGDDEHEAVGDTARDHVTEADAPTPDDEHHDAEPIAEASGSVQGGRDGETTHTRSASSASSPEPVLPDGAESPVMNDSPADPDPVPVNIAPEATRENAEVPVSAQVDEDEDDEAPSQGELVEGQGAHRRRSVHWPEEVVTEQHEADIFVTNSSTSHSSGASSPDAALASPEASLHDVDGTRPLSAAAENLPAAEPTTSLPVEAEADSPCESPAADVPVPIPPRLSLGALTAAVDGGGGGDDAVPVHAMADPLSSPVSAHSSPRERDGELVLDDGAAADAESAALALLDRLNGLDALLLAEFPHYFAKGRDADGRPTAVLRGEDATRADVARSPSARHARAWSTPRSHGVGEEEASRAVTFGARSSSASTTAPPAFIAHPQRIPLSTRPLAYAMSTQSGSGLFPVRRGSCASRGLSHEGSSPAHWSRQRSPTEAFPHDA